MNSASTVNMVNQVTEEKTPIVYRPFAFGNQIFVVAQQNIRRTEDVVSFNFGVLTANGQVIQIDPSQHSALFNIFLSQMEQQMNNANFMPYIQQLSGSNATQSTLLNYPSEKMDTASFHLTCSKSTSSTELTSQNIRASSKHSCKCCGIGKYLILDFRKADTKTMDGIHPRTNCSRLNARERLKQRKMLNDDCLV